jgi:DNA-binding NtrC family response regulator
MTLKKQQSGRARTDLLGHSILLVEDDFLQARDTQQALQHAGARVIGPFGDSLSALRSVENRKPSCAILDIRLNDGVHFSVASKLKERGIPFVFVTGVEPALIPDDLSTAPVLQKPVDFRSLLKLTAQLSAKRW